MAEDFFGTYKGRVTVLPDKPSGRPFQLDDGTTAYEPCYVDPWGRRHCGHPHTEPDMTLQDTYEFRPGWTAQT